MTNEPSVRCKVVRMDLQQFDRAADDPGLAALVREGWEVVTTVALDEPGGQSLCLLLRPPRPPAVVAPRPPVWAAPAFGALLIASGFALGVAAVLLAS
jgi:hypothetical protein